jgi:hypothetical protein
LVDRKKVAYKICEEFRLAISGGMGPVKFGLPVNLLQNICGTVVKE